MTGRQVGQFTCMHPVVGGGKKVESGGVMGGGEHARTRRHARGNAIHASRATMTFSLSGGSGPPARREAFAGAGVVLARVESEGGGYIYIYPPFTFHPASTTPARRGGPGREDARMHGLSAGSGPPTTHHRTTHHRGALSVGLPTGCNHVYMCHNTLAGSATVTRMEKEGEVCDKRTNLRNSGLNLSRS